MTSRRIYLSNHLLIAITIALGTLIGSDVSAAELILFEQIEGAPRLASRWFQAGAVSADGEVIALWESSFPSDSTQIAWTWTRSNGLREFVSEVQSAEAISADGNTVLLADHVWHRTTGELTPIEGHVLALSADGQVAAGADHLGNAAYWTNATGLQSLEISPSQWESQLVRGISADGSIFLGGLTHGRLRSERGNYTEISDGFIWRDGELIGLDLQYDSSSFTNSPALAFDISADGSTVLAHAQKQLFHYSSDGELVRSLGTLDGMGDFDDFDRTFLSSDGLGVIGSVKGQRCRL